jgi:hypothetical protein
VLGLGRRSSPAERCQGGGYLFGLHREGWIAAIADQPLKFDAYPLRRPRFETDTVDLRFRIGLGEARLFDHDFNTT